MCGIAVILKSVDVPCSATVLDRMRDEVAYRGPDDQGSVFFKHRGSVLEEIPPMEGSGWEIGMGHRRLSILDLSPAGHQPMVYGEKFWIVYNGEIFNFIEIRALLRRLGHSFRSSSDTEVILAAYAEWGPACFASFRGMWGLVILDIARNQVILSRDRLGIKPLYLWEGTHMVAVASEIKQFRHIPGFQARLDPKTAAEYLQTGYQDPRRTFFQDIRPVQAGSWLSIPFKTLRPSVAEEFWHPEKIQVRVTDAEEAGRLFADKVQESVRLHLRSDVPIGCTLSGGLDSSAVAVLTGRLKDGQGERLNTFSVIFPGDSSDEQEFVDAVLREIHASAHFVTPEPMTLLKELDRFLWIHDEPVGSCSNYAGYCLASLTRQAGVPVILSGQGGDEILSGYWQTYFLHLLELWRKGRLLTLAGHFLGALFGDGNPALIGQVPVMFNRYRARARPPLGVKFQSASTSTAGEVLKEILALSGQARRLHEIRVMFLPQLLKWEDRNSMAFSVEGRYPLLDHELIELCLSFAPQTLYSRGWTKFPLRVGMKKILPQKVRNRYSKFGFETPQARWLSGTLRPELERWLKSDQSAWEYVERKEVQHLAEKLWQLNGKQEELSQALFRVFAFDRWLSIYGVRS
jgi:asparagine synthase (glutamine-hydrolysing)